MTSLSFHNDVSSTTGSSDDGRYTIAVLNKAFDLLDAIAESPALTLSELSDVVGQNRPTTLRILANLVAREYAERDREGRYHLGLKLLHLGGIAAAGIDLRRLARPILEGLHARLQETINLAVPVDGGIVYIDIMESAHDLRMAATVGMRDSYHSSALGKAMLSRFAEQDIVRAVGSEPFHRKTSRTHTTLSEVQADIAQVRKVGYAIDDEENEPGARCLASPILDRTGQCVAALSMSGPTSRITVARVPDLAGYVRKAAEEISARLGYAVVSVPSQH